MPSSISPRPPRPEGNFLVRAMGLAALLGLLLGLVVAIRFLLQAAG